VIIYVLLVDVSDSKVNDPGSADFLHLFYYASTNSRQRRHYAFWSSGRPAIRPLSIRPLTFILCDTTYSVERFQWKLPQLFVMRMETAEKLFMFRGQMSSCDLRIKTFYVQSD